MFLLEKLICFLDLFLPLLIGVAFFTLAERKIMGSIQQRMGPNFVGFLGLMQPIADALKLMLKETVIPTNATTFGFIFAPMISLFLSLVTWAVIPFSAKSFFCSIDLSLLFILTVSSLGVYGVFLSG